MLSLERKRWRNVSRLVCLERVLSEALRTIPELSLELTLLLLLSPMINHSRRDDCECYCENGNDNRAETGRE